MRGGFEPVRFAWPADPPATDGVEFTSMYEGPRGPVFAGYADEDRTTVVTGDGVGEWRLAWGAGCSVLDEADRATALSSFPLSGPEQLALSWLRNDSKAGHAVHAIGAGERWVVTRRRRVGLALLRGRDDVIGVSDGRKPRIVADASPVEVVLLVLAHTGLSNLISPPSPYRLPPAGMDGP